jgi:hypothetical protein
MGMILKSEIYRELIENTKKDFNLFAKEYLQRI